MLAALSIRDFLLVDRLDLEFDAGLCVLTGETGAGKSILLDALGLALGGRADASTVRGGRAAVAATFEIDGDHPALRRLACRDIDPPAPGEPLVLRRSVAADGRSRAHVNDQPVSVGALREIGAGLVEMEGRFASHGLLDRAAHRAALDAFGGLGGRLADTRAAWDGMRAAEAGLAEARAGLERLAAESDWLRHARDELAELDPQPGEEEALAERRAVMMNGGRIAEAVAEGLSILSGEDGVRTRLGRALRILERADGLAAGRLGEALAGLERAAGEAAAADELLAEAGAGIDSDPASLQRLEDRLFALRTLARKHRTDVDSLAGLARDFAERLRRLDDGDRDIARLEREAAERRAAYDAAAGALSAARREAARALDEAIAAELPQLRLEAATFATDVSAAGDGDRRDGIDRVRFLVAANPGLPPGPVDAVASGGELARLLLALKVALRGARPVDTLVFDEVDAGVGGATASAVARRLRRLAEDAQVLVVTHSPQVAAHGERHFRIRKTVSGDGRAATAVAALAGDERREEIARMLAGATVTDAARAAADSLIAGARR